MTTFAQDVAELQRERANMFRRLEGSNLDVIFGQAAHTGPGAFWPANNAYGGAEVHDGAMVALLPSECDIPLRPMGSKSLPGMDALPVGSLVERMHFSARRLNNLLLGKYNPDQPRDDEGQWTDGVPGVGDGAPLSAKLKGAGRIDLAPGERLIKSDRVRGQRGKAWLAVVEKDGKRSLRIGLGNEKFGTRNDNNGPWRAAQDRSYEINEEREELRERREDLENEIEALEADPKADPAQLSDRRAQLEELENAEVDEVFPNGHTAILDEQGARQLRETLDKALTDGEAKQREVDDAYEAGRVPELPVGRNYWTLAEGSIPGDWADVHYEVYLDDPDIGVETKLVAIPHHYDQDFQSPVDDGAYAHFDIVEADGFVQLLAKMESRAPQVVQNRAPRLRNEMLPDGRVVKRDRKGRFAEKNAAAVLGELDDLMAKLKALSKHMSDDEKSDLDDALDNLKLVRRSRQATADAGGPDYLEIESQQYSSLEIQADDDSVTIDFDGGGFMLAPEEAEELAGFIDVFAEIDLPSWEWSPGNEAKVFAERTTSNGLFKAVLWENGVVEIGDSASTPAPDDGDSNLILDLNDDPDAARAVADALEELAETAAKRAQGGGADE